MKARDFKSRALDALRGNWFVAVIAGIIASLLGAGGGSVSFNFNTGEESVTPPANGQGVNIPTEEFLPTLATVGIGMLIVGILMLIIGSVVGVGYAQFNIDLMDGIKPRIRTLFSKFSQWKTAICANLLMLLRVFVGMIFFIIPGIIAAYKYSMVNYILADNPELTAREALRESAKIMKGHKWRLFCLELSFFGWILLSLFTFGIALIWVQPYQQAAVAAFYKEIK